MSDIIATLTETTIVATATPPANTTASITPPAIIDVTAVNGVDVNGSLTITPIVTTLVNGATLNVTPTAVPVTVTLVGGIGNVVSLSTSTDNDLVAFDGLTGKLIKDSGLLTSDVSSAVSLKHARSHAITSTSDHASSAVSGQMLQADGNGLPVSANVIGPATNILTILNSGAKSITFPGSSNDTVALLATQNIFTERQSIIYTTTALSDPGAGLLLNKTITPTADTSGNYYGVTTSINLTSANHFVSDIVGLAGGVTHSGTGLVDSIFGLNFITRNASTGTVTNQTAVFGSVENTNAGGTITNAKLFQGFITNAGTIVNLTGLYLPDIYQGTSNFAIQTNRGFVSLGDRVKISNYTAGNIALIVKGATSQSASILDVQNVGESTLMRVTPAGATILTERTFGSGGNEVLRIIGGGNGADGPLFSFHAGYGVVGYPNWRLGTIHAIYNGTDGGWAGNMIFTVNDGNNDTSPITVMTMHPLYIDIPVGVVINEGGSASYDFRVESDTKANMLFLDASANAIGIDQATPTALLHLGAGSATANTAPLKFTSGTLLTVVEAGAMEYWNNSFWLTNLAVRRTVVQAQSVATADLSVSNTTVETTIFTQNHGANYLKVGKHEDIWLQGLINTASGAGDTGTVRVKYAGNTLGTFTIPKSIGGKNVEIHVVITCRAIGAGTTSIQVHANCDIDGSVSDPIYNGLSTGLDSTTAQATTVTIQWATASASDNYTQYQARALSIDNNA
jgi:hypothetical protein